MNDADDSAPDATRSKVHALVVRARVLAREAWTDFRQNSVYFQIKAALVAAYIVIVLATLVLAPPPPPSFRLTAGHVPWGVAQRTYLDFDNLSLGTLRDVVLEVHGRVIEFDGRESRGPWRMTLPRVTQGESVRVWPEKLFSEQHRPAGDNLEISRVRVYPKGKPDSLIVDAAPKRSQD